MTQDTRNIPRPSPADAAARESPARDPSAYRRHAARVPDDTSPPRAPRKPEAGSTPTCPAQDNVNRIPVGVRTRQTRTPGSANNLVAPRGKGYQGIRQP